jgi:hypothetical protein
MCKLYLTFFFNKKKGAENEPSTFRKSRRSVNDAEQRASNNVTRMLIATSFVYIVGTTLYMVNMIRLLWFVK